MNKKSVIFGTIEASPIQVTEWPFSSSIAHQIKHDFTGTSNSAAGESVDTTINNSKNAAELVAQRRAPGSKVADKTSRL